MEEEAEKRWDKRALGTPVGAGQRVEGCSDWRRSLWILLLP